MIGIEGVDSKASGELIYLIANPYKIHYNKYKIHLQMENVLIQGPQTIPFAND